MARWRSAPLPLPRHAGEPAFARADLEVTGIRHAGDSFQSHVFLGNPDADEGTPLDAEHGYAGTFTVFAHGDCFGDVGHCDLPHGPRDPFDRRLPHPLTPANKTVTVTERLRALADAGASEVEVTIVTRRAIPGENGDDSPLRFDRLSLVTYD